MFLGVVLLLVEIVQIAIVLVGNANRLQKLNGRPTAVRRKQRLRATLSSAIHDHNHHNDRRPTSSRTIRTIRPTGALQPP
uniref:Secreted protein n=1 Tax=Plectus sambesii TaxID=2011161 RepID=A0A914VLC0_9BILA